ncbi:hypothetical protein DQ04_00141150 [Trypanosoma grayi]|uniref:hypothetical protein n=1 Tax=Trypanosoma grayi TaxID=71804 RepID=UPI0004F4787A|nr:hypothetical protein DQ04_00141150 [Trypanosoma grayi]KEG15227.1 hypothetical protein DQ04_00141150 [Trypanosoma grayi]
MEKSGRNEEDLSLLSSSSTLRDERPCMQSDGGSGAPSFATAWSPNSLSGFFRRGGAAPSFFFTREAQLSGSANGDDDDDGGVGGGGGGGGDGSNNGSSKSPVSACVVVVGDSCSGRTTIAATAAKAASRLRSAMDYHFASSGSSMTYAYRSSVSKRKECLLLNVVDGGPLPLRGGASRRFLPRCDAIIVTFALTGIKQKRPGAKKFLSLIGSSRSGKEGPPVIIHPKDIALLYDLLSMVVARVTPGVCSPKIILVGTHKDLLTDQSPSSVELLLKELRSICSGFLDTFQKAPVLNSLFAVSTLDGSCIPENRGGPNTVAAMWNFICDVALKEAATRGNSMQTQIEFNRPFFQDSFSSFTGVVRNAPDMGDERVSARWGMPHDSKDTLSGKSTNVSPSADSLMDRVHAKLLRLIFHVKAERKTVFIYLNVLWRLMYSLGFPSKKHFLTVLQQLQLAGELVLFHQRPNGLSTQNVCICLQPHLIERVQATVFLYASYVNYRCEEHGRLLTDVNLEACGRCDRNRDVSRGVFPQKLLLELARRLKLACSPSEAAVTFGMLLLLSDTAFMRRCRVQSLMSVAAIPSFISPPTEDGLGSSSALPVNYVDPSMTGGSSENLNNGLERSPLLPYVPLRGEGSSMEYVVPSLIRVKCPGEVINCVRRLVSASRSVREGRWGHSMPRLLALRGCPPDFFPMLTNRLHRYLEPSSPIFSQSLWLSAAASAGQPAPFLRMFICLTNDEWTNCAADDCPEGGVSLLELNAFSEVGYLPLMLFVDDITRRVAALVRHEFPGMLTWTLSNIPKSKSSLSSDGAYTTGVLKGMEKLSEVVTVRDLDSFFHSLDY